MFELLTCIDITMLEYVHTCGQLVLPGPICHSQQAVSVGLQVDAAVTERQVLVTVWQHMEELLASEAVDEAIRNLTAMLPDPSSFSSGDLPVLAKLHLSSAHNLMATLKLLAPAAFARGSSQPDLSALDDADSSLLGMVATLIELQLFHLQRAAAHTAASRNRLAQQRCAERLTAAFGSSCTNSGAGSSATLDERSTLTDLTDMSE